MAVGRTLARLMYLAAAVRREFGDGIDVAIWTLISSSRQPDQERTELLKQMEEYRPDIVGIRSLSIGQDAYHRAARTIKERDPECLVVAGGPYGTDDPAGVLCDGYTDCVVIGEGEVTFNELVRCVKNGLPCRRSPGSSTAERNHHPDRTRATIQDLESAPMPDYSLIDPSAFPTGISRSRRRSRNPMPTS
ncbi:MAG: cobalamin-dependent protein [Ignavibacteriae bacterium]|nr:cobalamin-dependent protein [Ignavibacteriota bacterium]